MRALVQDMARHQYARPVVILSNVAEAPGIAWARQQGLATTIVDHRVFGKDRAGFEDALNAALQPYAPQIICLAGFMRVLTKDFVELWDGHILNIHPSLLPKYRGLNTHARALANGDLAHGCTVHEVTAALDEGPILGQARVKVATDDTTETLAAKVLRKEHLLYPHVLRRFVRNDRRRVDL